MRNVICSLRLTNVCCFFYSDSELASKRQLYAFPRVGRGGYGYPDQSNLNRINLRLEELLLGQQLLGQPRSNDYVKRESENTNTGMWFGPRVGRSFNNDGKYESQFESHFSTVLKTSISLKKKQEYAFSVTDSGSAP